FHTVTVFPQQVAGDSVQCLHDFAWGRQEHDAIIDDRCGLGLTRFNTACPNLCQVLDVFGVDLVERAEAEVRNVAAIGKPVAWSYVLQVCVGDWLEVCELVSKSWRACKSQCGHGC